MYEQFELNIYKNFDKEDKRRFKTKAIIIISIVALIISLSIILFLFIALLKDKDNKSNKDDKCFKVLINNEKIIKPYTYNFESEIIELENGLKAILINEPNSNSSSIRVLSPYGSSLDVIPGLAHFFEHMSLRGSKNFEDGQFWTGYNFPGIINDAFTPLDYTSFYFSSIIGVEYENFLYLISDFLKNPLLNISVYKNEINIVNSEFLRSNITEDYILNNILSELANNKHPYYNQFGIGNNISLNSISNEEMEKYLKAYFQQAFNPKNLTIVLYSNKSISELEKLALKYFNYKIDINETIGNEEREQKLKKIKEERLFNKENGGKILKYFSKIANNLNDSNIYNLLTISFAINNLTYNKGFNPLDFLLFFFSQNSYLYNYYLKNNLVYSITPIIYPQFLGLEFGFFHIYFFITEKGLNNLEEVIKPFFHYLNLIKNSIDEIEQNIFPNYQRLKINKFNYYYDENRDLNDLTKKFILNMKKHGMENIFKDDVPDSFDKNLFLKFMTDNMNIENAIIALNSNYNISRIDLLNNYTTIYLNYYGIQYNITNLSQDFIQSLNKFPVDDEYINVIKLRDLNYYFTNISKPTEPCYLKNSEECENKKEYNPYIEKSYKKYKCNNNDTYLCYYVNDRSLNMPKVKIVLKIKSKTNNQLTLENKIYFNSICIQPKLLYEFKDFLEDPNNDFTITYQEELEISINTYKDIAVPFFGKFIDKLLELNSEEEFNIIINSLKNNFYKNIGLAYLNLEEYNKGAKLKSFLNLFIDNYPDYGYIELSVLNNFSPYRNYFHQLFINSFIDYSKLYLVGDLDDNLILQLSSIVENKIIINKTNSNRNIYNNNSDTNSHINYMLEEEKNKNLFLSVIKNNRISNIFAKIISNDENYNNSVINYIYSNNNTLEKESFTGLYYNIKMLDFSYYLHFDLFFYCIKEKFMTELRSRGLGYHCFLEYKYISSEHKYLIFYVQGAMKTPIEVQDDIQEVLYDIIKNWDCVNFDKIKNNYFEYNQYFETLNTFNRRVDNFISDKKTNIIDINQDTIPKNFREVVDTIRIIFENPIRIGIFEYANYIDSNFIEQEIENRKNETYFLNKEILVEYKKY